MSALYCLIIGVPVFFSVLGFGDLAETRTWRRLRGGRWVRYFHAPSTCSGWLRNADPIGSEVEIDAEDYRHPRAFALPKGGTARLPEPPRPCGPSRAPSVATVAYHVHPLYGPEHVTDGGL